MNSLPRLKVTPMKGGLDDPINRYRFENIRPYLEVDLTNGDDYDINLILDRKLYRNILRVFRNRTQGKKTILDITDDLFIGRYAEPPLRRLKRRVFTRNAVKWLVKNSDAVVCSSIELRDRYSPYSNAVHIDDAIDVSPSWKTVYYSRKPRIAWVGTPHNLYHLLPIEDVLKQLQEECGVEITLISRKNAISNLMNYLGRDLCFEYSLCEWDLSTYIQEIMENDIAIAPISGDSRSAAKSSNKLLTYMYHGMPVVASRIREYELHVVNGKNGYLATNEKAWHEYLLLLLQNPSEREEIGTAAREYARGILSIRRIADQWNDIIRTIQKPPETSCFLPL